MPQRFGKTVTVAVGAGFRIRHSAGAEYDGIEREKFPACGNSGHPSVFGADAGDAAVDYVTLYPVAESVNDVSRAVGNRENAVSSFGLERNAHVLEEFHRIGRGERAESRVEKARICRDIRHEFLAGAVVCQVAPALAGDPELKPGAVVFFEHRDVCAVFDELYCSRHSRRTASDYCDLFHMLCPRLQPGGFPDPVFGEESRPAVFLFAAASDPALVIYLILVPDVFKTGKDSLKLALFSSRYRDDERVNDAERGDKRIAERRHVALCKES